MKSNRRKIGFLVMIACFFFSTQVEAQRKKRGTKSRTQKTEEPVDLKAKLNYEIKLGNINISNNIFGLSAKPGVGYKIHEKITAGLGAKLGYTYINSNFASKKSYLDYGVYSFVRGKIIKNIYLQAEYGIQSFDHPSSRQNFLYPAIGGGYMQQGEKWSYGAELILNINDGVRSNSGIVEYWVSFSYNF